MAVKGYNGTAFADIGKMYLFNGTAFQQIGRAYSYNGADYSSVFSGSVPVTNLIGDAAATATYGWQDTGAAGFSSAAKVIDTVAGHRYYVRASVSSWAYGNTSGAYDGYGEAEFVEKIVSRNGTGHAIVTATDDTHNCYLKGQRYNSPQGGATATFYLVVDITALEEETGETFTADSFWAAIGEEVFYNTKEFDL